MLGSHFILVLIGPNARLMLVQKFLCGEQYVDKNSLLDSSFVLVFSQFIERTELVSESRKIVVERLHDNPR